MKCSDCFYYDCFMRNSSGGCTFGDTPKFSIPAKQPDPSDAEEIWKTTDAVAYLASRGWILIKPEVGNILEKVKSLRDAQNLHAKTLNYGYRCLAIRLGKEVDEMLDKLKIE